MTSLRSAKAKIKSAETDLLGARARLKRDSLPILAAIERRRVTWILAGGFAGGFALSWLSPRIWARVGAAAGAGAALIARSMVAPMIAGAIMGRKTAAYNEATASEPQTMH